MRGICGAGRQSGSVLSFFPLDTNDLSGVLAPDEAAAINSGTTKSEENARRALDLIWVRRSLHHAAPMLRGVAGAFAVFYLLGAVAFGGALLFYTFSR